MYSNKQYKDLINEIEEAKLIKKTKSQRQYYILDTFEVYEVAGLKKIIAKRKNPEDEIKYLVPFEDIFDSIAMCHKNVVHIGRDIMAKECSKRHINLTIELITCMNMFLIKID